LRPLQVVGEPRPRRGRPHRDARVRGGAHRKLSSSASEAEKEVRVKSIGELQTKEVTRARGQLRTLLADSTGEVFRRIGEGCVRTRTGDARSDTDEEARSRKAREGICGEVRTAPAIHFATARGRTGARVLARSGLLLRVK
jgi:hypothetical protein